MSATRTPVDSKVYTREDVGIPCKGEVLSAWIYRPHSDKRLPCVVFAPGMGMTKDLRFDAVGDALARAGFASVAFDYRCNGLSTGKPRNLIDPDWQYEDLLAAVRFAHELKHVDSRRVGVLGFSLGGNHVARLAAEQSQLVKALIGVCPMTDGLEAAWRMSSFSQQAVLGWYGLYDYLMGTDERPVTVSLIGDSGSAFSLMSLPGSFKEVRHLIPADMLLETMQRASRVPARIALKMPFLRPKRYYQHITIPTLVFVGTEDNVTLPVATVQNVIATPRLDIKAYECGHYGLLHGELFPAAMADCIDFLKRHLVPSSD